MLIKKREINPLEKKVIDNIRGLSIDMINEAGGGHPGVALGAAPIIYNLYANFLRFDVNNPNWINRDRFVLSAGHASALLYSTLYMSGFDITLDDLKGFRKLNSKTPGHPEINVTPGVDMSTGPLGQGFANAVGIALAERYLNKNFNKNIIDFYTYCLCGDGDLMEGVSYEAASLAGNLGLNKLIVFYDSNNTTLDGNLSDSFSENVKLRFESMNWSVITVSDGEDLLSLSDAITKAKESDKPTLIEVKTTIGKYSKLEGTNKVHGGILEQDDIRQIKEKLSLRDIPFQVSDEAVTFIRETINDRMEKEISNWMKLVVELDDTEKEKLDMLLKSKDEIKIKDIEYEIPVNNMESTRVSSGKILNSICKNYPFMLVGSADVSSSTKVKVLDSNEKNIMFGVREHAMGAIANGIATTGITPVISTFLSFSDYMKPAIRMSAMMNLPVIYVFTHDSITVGEDGPTHQPVEQLVGLRSIPNIDVYRPSDANEVLGSYKSILETRKPSVLILGRNEVLLQSSTKVNEVKHGAYIVKPEKKRLDAIIITTGEELQLTLDVSAKLEERGIDNRIISMPSIELFERMDDEYRENLIPKTDNVFVIEASSPYSWDRFTPDRKHLFTVNTFGKSANYRDLLEEYNFTENFIEEQIEDLIK